MGSKLSAHYCKGTAAGDESLLCTFIMAFASLNIHRLNEYLKKRQISINCHTLIKEKEKKRTRTEKEGDKGKESILHVTTQMQTKLNIVNTFAVLSGLLGAIQQQSISSSRF